MTPHAAAAREFEAWYLTAYPRTWAAVIGMARNPDEAKEATDEAFARAWERWERVSSMASPDGWVIRVGINATRRRWRRRRLEAEAIGARDSDRPDASTDGLIVEDWLQSHALYRAVASLPNRQRFAVVLRYFADLPEAQVAASMGVSRGTVASTLAEARRALGRRIELVDRSGHG